MYYSPVRHPTGGLLPFHVGLACVKHAASVRSEPGSNSPVSYYLTRARDLHCSYLVVNDPRSLPAVFLPGSERTF